MSKHYIDKDVHEAAVGRIAFLFREFDNVLVAFSGGKDSTVCLHLAYDYAREHGLLDRLAFYHLDYEAQYRMTTDFVTDTFRRFTDIERRYWLCLPISAQCCCSMKGGSWIPWERAKKALWVREMPQDGHVIDEDRCPFPFRQGEADYAVQERFSRWFSRKNGRTAVVIGIRADESLRRYHAVANDDKKIAYRGIPWISTVDGKTVNAYPIYDWTAEDDFVYFGRFSKPYNRLYDLFHKAGLKPDQMRVASPFNDCAAATLRLYKTIDPNTWGRMVGRVNGVNFTALYGSTTAMGWKGITKPDGMTWRQYADFLLSTMDERTRNHYLSKLRTSMRFWKETGAGLDEETIGELEREGVPLERRGRTSNRTDKEVVTIPEYLDDTEAREWRLVPTFKRFCVCIMKNDWNCKYMGFGQTKEELRRRSEAIRRYKDL